MKLLNGENKKLLQNPSYYFTILLILVVILLAAINYTPQNSIKTIQFENMTHNEIIEHFNYQIKSECSLIYKDASNLVTYYTNRKDAISLLNNSAEEMLLCSKAFMETKNTENKNIFKQKLIKFKNDFIAYNTSNTPIFLLMKTDLYEEYVSYFEQICNNMENNNLSNNEFIDFLSENNFELTINKLLENLYEFNVSSNTLNELKSSLEKTDLYLKNKAQEIINTSNIEAVTYKINEYYLQTKTGYDLVYNKILIEGLKSYSDMLISQFKNVNHINIYDAKEIVIKCNYLIDNQKSILEYANVPNIINTASYNASIYDFAYLCTEISFLVIVFYMIFVCSYTISGEFSRGTLKLLLIRPYKRFKVILSKITSCAINATILIIISYFASLFAGSIFIKNPISLQYLLVFNAEKLFIVDQVTLSLIYLISLALKMYIIVLFFVTISTFFSKEINSIMVCSFITLITLLMKKVIIKISIFNFMPNLNISLFKYFGGSSNLGSSTNILMQSPNMTIGFYSTIIYMIVSVILLNIISIKKFKRLDVK